MAETAHMTSYAPSRRKKAKVRSPMSKKKKPKQVRSKAKSY